MRVFFYPMQTISQKSQWRFPVTNSLVRDGSLSRDARLLYIMLQGYVGPSCEMPFPSLATLSSYMGCHRDSVQKYLAELVVAGLIKKHVGRAGGKFQSTRYELIEHKPEKSPQRKKPATVNSATKRYHWEELYGDAPDDHKKKAKEAKEDAIASQRARSVNDSQIQESVEYKPRWKPNPLTKEQQLARLKPPHPDSYPSQVEFEAFLEDAAPCVNEYRPNLYDKLCDAKWMQWREKLNKWVPIRDWRKYAASVEAKILERR